jgi:hypothetical protein
MIRIRTEFKAFRNRRKIQTLETHLLPQGTDAELIALTTSQENIIPAAVTLYFQTFENTYRILHEPSFLEEYHTFWNLQEEQPRSAGFAAILLLIVAITKCLSPGQSTVFVGDSSVERESASDLIGIVDAWLQRHSRKHGTLTFFQVQCLSILAKRVNSVKMKQDWVQSGDVMRMAIASGLHRKPSLLLGQRISEFEKEMRRRLWGTIMELELQSSIDCGLPSSLCNLYFDVEPPANVTDELFTSGSEEIPTKRPMEEFTNTSYLAWSRLSLSLRIHLQQILNNPTTNLQYADILHYDTKITSLISSLPHWAASSSRMPSALLELQLRQFLLLLHHPYAMLASHNPRFSYSFAVCVNTASSIVSLHEGLLEENGYVLNHIRTDAFRTVITLAQIVYDNSSFSQSPPTLGTLDPTTASEGDKFSHGALPSHSGTSNYHTLAPKNLEQPSQPPRIPSLPQHNILFSTLCTTSIPIMESARSLFEAKVLRLGTGYMESWLMAAAIGIMPSTPATPSTTATAITAADDICARGRKANERITSLCFRVLAMQKDPGSEFSSTLRSTISNSPNALSETQYGSTPESRVGPSGLVSESGNNQSSFLPGVEGMAQALGNGMGLNMGNEVGFDSLQPLNDFEAMNFPEFWGFDFDGGL